MKFLTNTVDLLSRMPPLVTRANVLSLIHDRISALKTGISVNESRPGPTSTRSMDINTGVDVFDDADKAEIHIPSVTEPDTSQSTITIDDVAWGRQSKRIFATNHNSVAGATFPSRLSFSAEQDWEMPTESQARVLVAFHTEYVCWLHNTIYSPDFLEACEDFWETGHLDHPLWLALYLSIMSVGHTTCFHVAKPLTSAHRCRLGVYLPRYLQNSGPKA